MDKMGCMICGYLYDPQLGDADNDIVKGIAFDDLPDEWICPECGAGKEMFEVEKG